MLDEETLLQLGSAVQQKQEYDFKGKDAGILSIDSLDIRNYSVSQLRVLFSNQHLQYFNPVWNEEGGLYDDHARVVSYEMIKILVSALAAEKITHLEYLDFGYGQIEWEQADRPSAWIEFWELITVHPTLCSIKIGTKDITKLQSWWQPIAAAIKANPQIMSVSIFSTYPSIYSRCPSEEIGTPDEQELEPLLERNRYQPKIAALCSTDSSNTAAWLVQAIVSVTKKENKRSIREIHQMLLHAIVGTPGYELGTGIGRVVGKKRPLTE